MLHEWGEWEEWSTCSKTCGSGGIKRRSRVCVDVRNNIVLSGASASCIIDLGVSGEEEISCNEEIKCSIGKLILS